MIRTITKGVLSERDRLLNYTVGEFYQELSLFLEEASRKQKHLEKITSKQ